MRLDALNTVVKAVSLAGAFVSLILGFVLCVTGAFVSTTALSVLALQAIWIGLCFISPVFAMTVSRLLRKITWKKQKAENAEALGETDAAAPAEEPAETETPEAVPAQDEEQAPSEAPESPETQPEEATQTPAEPAEGPQDPDQQPPAAAEPEAEDAEPVEDTLEERIDAIPAPPPAPAPQGKSKRRLGMEILNTQKTGAKQEKSGSSFSFAFLEPLKSAAKQEKPAAKQEEKPAPKAPAAKAEKSVDDALNMFAPKDEPKEPEKEEALPRFIASEKLQESFFSINDFISDISETDAPTEDGDAPKPDFSLYGKEKDADRYSARDAADIEREYERRKEEERSVRSRFTAPEIDGAPIYDLRKKQPAPQTEAKFTAPLDTSDVNIYNNELFRRFENDDDVFAGLHEDEHNPKF